MNTITSKKEFEQVFFSGKRTNHPLVRIRSYKRESPEGAVAFVAAKRLGNAVWRNRCKRLLREAAYAQGFPLEGWSVIVFGTQRTNDATLAEIEQALYEVVERAGLKGN